MNIESIEFASTRYTEALALRNQVLRQPLGLSLENEDLSQEHSFQHFGVFENSTLIACIVAVPLTPSKIKLKQMAVLPAFQGRGIGAALVLEVETRLKNEGVRECILAARESALGFYQKLGYRTQGNAFIQVGLKHFTMSKTF